VGYAGGTKDQPTYRQMGDHTETLEIDFDPTVIKFEEILDLFWQHHNALRTSNDRGRQYTSLLLYRNDEQKTKALEMKSKWEGIRQGSIHTEISPYTTFYLAEEKHQKYYLKRYPKAFETLIQLFSTHQEFVDSTLVARLNGFVREFGSLKVIRSELESWQLVETELKMIINLIHSLKW
jgi:peptide-methionine (S)-S-oxide reductase